ncbi:hypothetical protein A2Z22_01905 [Candidatus Woesebacteria bacterium RBG_16_34_12]|uniref:Uncharacterized protein n=1 Tax=Candidatus Woesebacteria bacterium RBG_16_34_12 TaxID=1802480 RepID=A0A1F7XAI8_9BACT|nr:MAG: hypothetical protein A2Z22_01905 [Candidatus Woesebacteria bacterium RBG_16_34_12]
MEEVKGELFNSYFIRHTEKLGISPEAILELYSKNLIFIHYPDCKKTDPKTEDKESLNPDDYKDPIAKSNIKRFKDLSINGGIVWAEYYGENNIKIGIVPPNSEIKLIKCYKWKNEKYPNRKNKVAVIKAIQIRDVKEIEPGKLMNLRVAQPRQRTFGRWWAIKNKLYCIHYKKQLESNFSNLSSDEQEVVCQEFLRNQKLFPNIPQLNYLLLPPGRTMKDIDIYGLSNENKKIFAQVTYLEKPETKDFKNKVANLKRYSSSSNDNYLLFFSRCPELLKHGNILYIPINVVENWLKQPGQEYYLKLVYSQSL